MDVFEVRSARDEGLLRFAWNGKEWWRVDVELPGLSATAKIDPFAADGDRTLALLFRRLADDWKGWDGVRDWSSIEGTLDLRATHDGLGHVPMRVRIRSSLYEDAWNVEGTVWLEAGGLSKLARDAAAFEAAQPS